MKYKIYKKAESQIIKIWQYTEEKWGEEQANKYVQELYESFKKISSKPELCKKIEQGKIINVFYFKYKNHFVFFRNLSDQSIGIITILHEKMNIPERLKEDLSD